MTTWIKYVPHAMVKEFEANGWKRSDGLDGTHHGHHAVIMIWEGDGEPPK